MKKIRLYFRWLFAYWFGSCFDCKKSKVCKYSDTWLCGHCDQRIFDMCGYCRNRHSCSIARRQKFARDDDWR